MASLPSPAPNDFLRDLGFAQAEVAHGVVPSRSTAAAAHWTKWEAYCDTIGIHPTLREVSDPIPYLQVFAYRFRHGHINTTRRPVRKRTVEGALRSVGQAFAAVGSPDPRFTPQGKLEFRLKRQLASYDRLDPPPSRVKPIPVPLLQHIMAQAILSASVHSEPDQALADMLCLAFFFLLRPGEYTGTKSDTQPFRLTDIRFRLGDLHLDPHTTPPHHLLSATFVTLEFTEQKNGVRGEVIGLSRSGDPHFCPVGAAARRVIHLRAHGDRPWR
jgi:hypothetical protein